MFCTTAAPAFTAMEIDCVDGEMYFGVRVALAVEVLFGGMMTLKATGTRAVDCGLPEGGRAAAWLPPPLHPANTISVTPTPKTR